MGLFFFGWRFIVKEEEMIVIDCEKPKCCSVCFALTYMGSGEDSYDDECFACGFDINRKIPYGCLDTRVADDCPIKEINKGE